MSNMDDYQTKESQAGYCENINKTVSPEKHGSFREERISSLQEVS